MEKQIDFKGVNLTPYDDIAPDGQLSVCANLERHAGSLRPVSVEGTVYAVTEDNVQLVFVHNTASFNHFIFYDKDRGQLSWSNQDPDGLSLIKFGKALMDIASIHAVGNTLVALTPEGIYYYLFDSDNYQDLGEFPDISLSFGLRGSCIQENGYTINFEEIRDTNKLSEFSDNNKTIITNAVMAGVNSFIAERGKEEGRFIFPFFVRYALRLYDGTLIKHSAPVLMLCNNTFNPVAFADLPSAAQTFTTATIQVAGIVYSLDYVCSSADDIKALEKWKDIITSVDIFVSEQIFTLTPDGLCTRFASLGRPPATSSSNFCVCRNSSKSDSQYYQYWDFMGLYESVYGTGKHSTFVLLPYKEAKEIDEEIADTSNFYLLKSVANGNLSAVREWIKVEDNYLSNLVSKEKMTDDYDSHNQLIASYGYVYNSRLNIANLKKRLFSGYNTESIFCYNGPGYYNGTTSVQRAVPHTCYVYIKENGKEYIVENRCDMALNEDRDKGTFLYFYYPSVNAYKVEIYSPITQKVLTLPLKVHNFLNGAFFYEGFKLKNFTAGSRPKPTDDNMVAMPNKIYTSEVGNPFYFPLRGINTVGVGEIVGMAAVTTALSQGQFGQFPLMVFCTDGNYAMQVSSEGLFSGIIPMQRDVCVNQDSITQIDGAVVFVSARGVMVADGSVISGISEVLNGVFDDLHFISDMDKYSYSIPDKAPVEFFRDCMIAYDYAGKRLLFFSRELNNDAVWVMSLEDNTWSQAEFSGVTSVLNSYPYAYIQMDGGHKIIRLDEAYKYRSEDIHSGILVTRPLKLDSYQLKSLRQVALVGCFSTPQTVGIYASNDGSTWFLLGKSKAGRILTPGRYFKYYRFSVETELKTSENISGLRVEYEVRPERRFR